MTNNTGNAISSLSYIPYKLYDSNGTVLKTGNVYLEALDNEESCNEEFYLEENTVKILFGVAEVYQNT